MNFRMVLVCAALALPAMPALAQDNGTSGGGAAGAADPSKKETLADIRQELTMLKVEIDTLKREQSTTGNTGQVMLGSSTLDKINGLQQEVQRLTGETEELGHRIDQIVSDGTQRIGDLNFRLTELEGGDVSKLGDTPVLGGKPDASQKSAPSASLPPQIADDGTDASNPEQLAVGEKAAYQAAEQKLKSGDYAGALKGFSDFANDYPGSPLEPKAQIGRAEALAAQGDPKSAGRAYLDSFTLAPKADTAPTALLGLGKMLAQLGQTNEACRTLEAVPQRFPGSPEATEAKNVIQAQGCS